VDDLVTVFESGDFTLLTLAKTALESGGIRYVVEGEGVQDLFGMGRLFSGYNLITGAPRIRVTAENAERARELLTSGGVYGAT
jgi:hypothetical protein